MSQSFASLKGHICPLVQVPARRRRRGGGDEADPEGGRARQRGLQRGLRHGADQPGAAERAGMS